MSKSSNGKTKGLSTPKKSTDNSKKASSKKPSSKSKSKNLSEVKNNPVVEENGGGALGSLLGDSGSDLLVESSNEKASPEVENLSIPPSNPESSIAIENLDKNDESKEAPSQESNAESTVDSLLSESHETPLENQPIEVKNAELPPSEENEKKPKEKHEKIKKEKKPFKFTFRFLTQMVLCAILVLNIVSLFVPLAASKFKDNGILLSLFLSSADALVVLCLIPQIINIVFCVVSLINAVKYQQTKSTGAIVSLMASVLLLLFNRSMNYFSSGLIAVLILSIIASATLIGFNYYLVLRSTDVVLTKKEKVYLGLNIGFLVLVVATLFIPYNLSATNMYAADNVLICGLTKIKSISDINWIPAIVFYVAIVVNLCVFDSTIISYFTMHDYLEQRAKSFSVYSFILTLIYFVYVLVYRIVSNSTKTIDNFLTVSFVPFIAGAFMLVIHNYVIGKVHVRPVKVKADDGTEYVEELTVEETIEKEHKNKIWVYRVLFAILLSILMGLLVFSYFQKFIIIKSNNGSVNIFYTVFDILLGMKQSASSFALLGYVFLVFGIIDSVLYIFTMCAVFSGSKSENRLAKMSVIMLFISMLLLSITSFYYLAAIKTTPAIITSLFPAYPEIAAYIDSELSQLQVSNDVIWPGLGAIGVLIIILISNPITKIGIERTRMEEQLAMANITTNPDTPLESTATVEGGELNGEGTEEAPQEEEVLEEEGEKDPEKVALVDDSTNTTFDNCPSFTQLDEMELIFQQETEERRTKLFENLTLPNLVDFVINYAKNCRIHLSYTREDIATFVAGLGSTRLSILQGMSGTGKTSLPKIFMEAILGNCEIIEVESSWRDKNELLGYYNEFSKIYSPKKFTRALYKASLNPEVVTFIVLDEMNLSRIEYYFSDFLSLMENEEGKREIQLLNNPIFNTYDFAKHAYKSLKNNNTLMVPSNVWFIGTANRDESTFEISDKVYDRAYTMNFDKRAAAITKFDAPMEQRFVTYEMLADLFNHTKSVGFSIDKSEVIKEVEKALLPYNISFGNRIAMQMDKFIRIYCACFPNKKEGLVDEALETILLSKVVHKLEYKNVTNKEELVRLFKKLKLEKCADFVSKLIEEF